MCRTKADKANTVPRRPYPWTVGTEGQDMATSMAHYQKMLHCRARVSKMRLALT